MTGVLPEPFPIQIHFQSRFVSNPDPVARYSFAMPWKILLRLQFIIQSYLDDFRSFLTAYSSVKCDPPDLITGLSLIRIIALQQLRQWKRSLFHMKSMSSRYCSADKMRSFVYLDSDSPQRASEKDCLNLRYDQSSLMTWFCASYNCIGVNAAKKKISISHEINVLTLLLSRQDKIFCILGFRFPLARV